MEKSWMKPTPPKTAKRLDNLAILLNYFAWTVFIVGSILILWSLTYDPHSVHDRLKDFEHQLLLDPR